MKILQKCSVETFVHYYLCVVFYCGLQSFGSSIFLAYLRW